MVLDLGGDLKVGGRRCRGRGSCGWLVSLRWQSQLDGVSRRKSSRGKEEREMNLVERGGAEIGAPKSPSANRRASDDPSWPYSEARLHSSTFCPKKIGHTRSRLTLEAAYSLVLRTTA